MSHYFIYSNTVILVALSRIFFFLMGNGGGVDYRGGVSRHHPISRFCQSGEFTVVLWDISESQKQEIHKDHKALVSEVNDIKGKLVFA